MADHKSSYPDGETLESWRAILREIAAGFRAHAALGDPPDRLYDTDPTSDFGIRLRVNDYKAWATEQQAIVDRGFSLFVKWYGHLWD